MLVTGNNTNSNQKILSIRLSADGLSFWTSEMSSCANLVSFAVSDNSEKTFIDLDKNVQDIKSLLQTEHSDGIYVYIDSAKTILVPTDVLQKGHSTEFVNLHNLKIDKFEQIDISSSFYGVSALIVSDSTPLQSLGQAIGEFTVLSPLQHNMICANSGIQFSKKKAVVVYCTPTNAYISLFKEENDNISMLYSAVHPYKSAADVIYYINWIDTQFDSSGANIYITEDGSENVRSSLQVYYNNRLK